MYYCYYYYYYAVFNVPCVSRKMISHIAAVLLIFVALKIYSILFSRSSPYFENCSII